MKMDFRGVPGMGKTIEEKMKEYNELKGAIQNYSKKKETYKKQSNAQLRETPWGQVIFGALLCIIVGAMIMLTGIARAKRTIANHDDRVYVWAEIEDIRMGWNGYETRLKLEYDVNGKSQTAYIETNKTRDEFMIGQIINVYYYKNNPSSIYETANEASGFVAPVVGGIFIILGFVIVFTKVKAGNIKRKR